MSSTRGRQTKREVQIQDCDVCNDLADQAFDSINEVEVGKIAIRFLEHVINEHTGEVMAVLAEKYGPIFMSKRALR